LKFIALLLGFILASTTLSSAKIWTCSVTAVGGYKGVMPTKMTLNMNSNVNDLIIKDDVGAKMGLPTIQGNMKRRIGSEQLFAWELSPIPQNTKPPTESKFYENKVIFRGRLNLKNGGLKIVGDFVTRVPSANTGLNMRGRGKCK
jgi:hypothetical protein